MTATREDGILSKVLHFTKNGWPANTDESLKPYHSKHQEITVEGDCLYGVLELSYIPTKHRDHILTELHRDHPGCSRMKTFARSYVWWPDMDKV
jgi:hypothetical protein